MKNLRGALYLKSYSIPLNCIKKDSLSYHNIRKSVHVLTSLVGTFLPQGELAHFIGLEKHCNLLNDLECLEC